MEKERIIDSPENAAQRGTELFASYMRAMWLLGRSLANQPRIGPGRRTIWGRPSQRSRYDGAALRVIRARVGIGRPPKRSVV